MVRQTGPPLDLIQIRLFDIADDVFPGRVEAEAAFLHFPDGFLFRPAADGDAVHGAHHPRAVRATLAVDDRRQIVRIDGDFQELNHLFRIAAPRFHFKPHAFQTSAGHLVLVRVPGAQVDDRLDPHRLQILETFRRRLRAAIQIARDLKTVFDAGDLDGLHMLLRRNQFAPREIRETELGRMCVVRDPDGRRVEVKARKA